ncbi:MAG: cell wall-binding repeat-containing protein [Acidothermaceae bacterium]
MILAVPVVVVGMVAALPGLALAQTSYQGNVTSNTYDATAGSGPAPTDGGAPQDPLQYDCTTPGGVSTPTDTQLAPCQNVGLTHGYFGNHDVNFLYTANFFCDNSVASNATTGCEAGTTYTKLPPDATSQDPLYIPVPLGFTPSEGLQCPVSGNCIDHPTTVDTSALFPTLQALGVAQKLGITSASQLNNAPLNMHSHVIYDRNNNLPEWWNVVVVPVTSQAGFDSVIATTDAGQLTALAADSNSGVPSAGVPTNVFLYFQVLAGTSTTTAPATMNQAQYNGANGPSATPGVTHNPLTATCTADSTTKVGTSPSDACGQVGVTPGFLNGTNGTASGSNNTVQFLYSENFFCDKAVSASSANGCEAGAAAANLPPGTTSVSQTDPLYIITPIGFSAANMHCPTPGYCIDHPYAVDLSRLASALGAPASSLTDVPLNTHNHIVLTRNNNQPEWWPVTLLPVTDPATYNQINSAANPYTTYQSLVSAGNKAVLGAVPTNISLWFQTLPGVVPNRVAGADRLATAVAASQDAFPAGSATSVVLARDDLYPDAMVGGPLAAAKNGPVLLTPTASLSSASLTEIGRVLSAKSDTVYVLGETSAVSQNVVNQLTAAGYPNITRLAGPDRYGTAVAVAKALGSPATTFLATGQNFPDALTAGPAAAQQQGAILLTTGGTLGGATAAYLAGSAHTVYAVGGLACAADTSATCYAGTDRYQTSMKVAAKFFPTTHSVGIAIGTNFPDALSATPDMAMRGGPLLLVAGTGTLPDSTTSQLASYMAQTPQVNVYGDNKAVSDSVVDQIVATVDGTTS